MRIRWYVTAGIACAALLGFAYLFATIRLDSVSQHSTAKSPTEVLPRVEVVAPVPGGLVRTTTQPGSVHAFEHADLYAKVSGYLKTQSVDIGDQVKTGQV